ncbi:molecular chaperone DnaK [Methylocystis sp. IM2]|uniref:molecular chaperone DnaK n=1 Tax=Methylocystis sp. IM2 TaxID=3136563 RepID=UPI0030FC7DE3
MAALLRSIPVQLRDAEAFLGKPINQAVATVPAYFDDNQRNATKDAAGIAGLEVLRLVNEPTAASLAYGLDRLAQELRIAVIDFGGGTLDVTIMEFGKGVFEVKATSGNTRLGGTDMDNLIFEYLADRFRVQSGLDMRNDKMVAARIKEAGEVAKIELSTNATSHISLPFLAAGPSGPRHFDYDLTRAELERIVRPVVERCREPVLQAFHDAGIESNQVDRLVFVGGPTRMPMVRAFFEELVERRGETGIDPMECVAQGAAIQAGVLAGEVGSIVLVDVTPLTLGIETLGGVATPLIARNTPIPIKRAEIFTTAADLQTSVTIHVVQGERPMAPDNTSLGEFNLDGLPPAPRGVPKVEVTLDIDADGILHVTAKDMASRRSQSIRITGSTRLPENEKQRMIGQAAHFAEQDRKRREEAEKLNNADAHCYQAERTLADFGSRLSDDVRQRIETALSETREALSKRDADAAAQKASALKVVLQESGQALYAQAPQPGAQPRPDIGAPTGAARPAGSGPGARVVEAEYKSQGAAEAAEGRSVRLGRAARLL